MRNHVFPLDTAADRCGTIRGKTGRCDDLNLPVTGGVNLVDIGMSVTDHSPGTIIAVVDDDPSILKSLEYLLESADHGVLVFGSAAALLESGCLARIDCLISDIDMPVIDGFDLLRLVCEARPELPVVLITGHPEVLDRLPAVGAGHHRLFKKPFDGQELLTAVSDATRSRRLSRPES